MAFTDETTVRKHLGGIDSSLLSSEVVQQGIEEAHQDVTRDLRSEFASSTDVVLKQAETELATACLLRILASRFSIEESEVQTPMLKILAGHRVEHLLQRAQQEEKRARGRLAPFLQAPPSHFEFGLLDNSGAADRGRQ